jgi:hypothetical protein
MEYERSQSHTKVSKDIKPNDMTRHTNHYGGLLRGNVSLDVRDGEHC